MLTLLVFGTSLVLMAGFVSNTAIETFLLGRASNVLEWGPTLFRILLAIHGLGLILVALFRRRRGRGSDSDPVAFNGKESGAIDKDRFPWIPLAILSAVALTLRLWHLNSDLWYDELITLLDFVRPPVGEIVTSFASQNQHMLFSFLAHLSIAIFGESAWSLRLPSVLFGVSSLWALFLMSRRVVGTRVALLACALMTVSYHHIWFSQNARGYMGVMFFATLSTWLWLEALSRDSWKWWFFYAGAVAMGMWVHMTMAFVVTTHVLVYLLLWTNRKSLTGSNFMTFRHKESCWKPPLAFLLCGSITLQLYALSLPEFLRTALNEVSLKSEWTNPLWMIKESLQNLQMGFSGILIALVLTVGGLLVCLGWWSIVQRDWSVGLLMVLPGLIGAFTMIALGHNLWPRFFFFSLGFALLILMHGAMTIPRLIFTKIRVLRTFKHWSEPVGLFLTGLMIATSIATLPRCYALPKQDFSGARQYVEHVRKPEEGIVAVGLAGVAYSRYFAPYWSIASNSLDLETALGNNKGLWLVYTLPIEVKTYHPAIWDKIVSEFKTVKVFPGTLSGGEVIICKNRD